MGTQVTRRLLHRVIVTGYRTYTRGFRTSSSAGIMAPIKVGDPVPSVDLFEGNPDTKVNLAELFAKGTNVLFAIPGAFTPTCEKDHFPTYLTDLEKLKAKGVQKVACLSVNDPFVMAAFCKSLGAEGKITCLADPRAEFTKAVDLTLDATAALGNIRSQRYAMVIKDGKVAAINVEESPGQATCSKAAGVLDLL